jgi:hypothetical protein
MTFLLDSDTARITPSKMLPSEDRRAICDVTFRAYEA